MHFLRLLYRYLLFELNNCMFTVQCSQLRSYNLSKGISLQDFSTIITVYQGGARRGYTLSGQNPLCVVKLHPPPLKNYTLCSAPPSGIWELGSLWKSSSRVFGYLQFLSFAFVCFDSTSFGREFSATCRGFTFWNYPQIWFEDNINFKEVQNVKSLWTKYISEFSLSPSSSSNFITTTEQFVLPYSHVHAHVLKKMNASHNFSWATLALINLGILLGFLLETKIQALNIF